VTGLLVVLASRFDDDARALVEAWHDGKGVLLTPDDLAQPGWRFDPAHPASGCAVVGGRAVPMGEIGGVVTRLPRVFPEELDHIVPADRSYVAAESTAFLLAWLSALDCPVMNRPTATCLAGPWFSNRRWAYEAARLGIALATEGVPAAATATVVGPRAFGDLSPVLAGAAVALAGQVGADMLAVYFDGTGPGARFVGAGLFPALAHAPVVTQGIRDRLRELT
jgi:hypothetical protein